MQISIENYQCYYQRNDKDEARYRYIVDWDDIIVDHEDLNEVIKMLRDTYKERRWTGKPIAIAVFVCEEEKTVEELAKELR